MNYRSERSVHTYSVNFHSRVKVDVYQTAYEENLWKTTKSTALFLLRNMNMYVILARLN